MFKSHPALESEEEEDQPLSLSMGRKIWRGMLIAYVNRIGDDRGKDDTRIEEDEKSFRYWTVTILEKRYYSELRPKSRQGLKPLSRKI